MWRRLFGRRDVQRDPERNDQEQPAVQRMRSQTPTVTFRPMTQAEYELLRSWLDEDYAQDVAQAMAMSPEEGRAAAQKQLAELLPTGLSSEGHCFWKITAPDGAAVGDLWVQIGPAKGRAFIYFIGIDEAFRGKGYGRAAMQALEAEVRLLGATRIDLSVFGDNVTAIHLYQSLGYQIQAMGMRKPI